MTSEMGEMFNALRKMRQEKRRDNRESSPQILTERGVTFEEKNNGAHLIVKHGEKIVDFWPGTGKWIDRGGKKGRGVFPLLKHLGASDGRRNED